MNGKRKFALAGFSLLAGTAMVFTGRMDGSAWIGLVGTILALYGAANVVDKKMGGAG